MVFPISTDILLYIVCGLLIFLCIWILRLEMKIGRLLAGKDGKSLEDAIHGIQKGWETERKFKEEMQHYLVGVEKRLVRSIRGIETVKFNAFKGTISGGNQSFATCYLNEKGDGVLISSLNAHDRVSVFSKPIRAFTSELTLTPEEKEALERARVSLKV